MLGFPFKCFVHTVESHLQKFCDGCLVKIQQLVPLLNAKGSAYISYFMNFDSTKNNSNMKAASHISLILFK